MEAYLGGAWNAVEVISTTTQFEFRLIGAESPQGQIDVDDVVAILQKLQELATKVGRIETGAEERGRPSKNVKRVAKLRLVGLRAGSTVIEVQRVRDEDKLTFNLEDEVGFDARFADIIDAIGADTRPATVTNAIAETAADLVVALQKAAPEIEFSTAGVLRRAFKTAETHRETWRSTLNEGAQESVTVVGRLYAVNLKSHRLQVQDDLGNEFALPKVENDALLGHLLGAYVSVTGVPEKDSRGRVSEIHGAVIELAPQFAESPRVRESVSLDDILATSPGPAAGGIPGLREDEANAFFKALGA